MALWGLEGFRSFRSDLYRIWAYKSVSKWPGTSKTWGPSSSSPVILLQNYVLAFSSDMLALSGNDSYAKSFYYILIVEVSNYLSLIFVRTLSLCSGLSWLRRWPSLKHRRMRERMLILFWWTVTCVGGEPSSLRRAKRHRRYVITGICLQYTMLPNSTLYSSYRAPSLVFMKPKLDEQ